MATRGRHRRPLRVRRRIHWPRVTRDGVIFGLGVVGFLHELIVRSADLPERFYILATSVALMGLPPILRLDERRKGPPALDTGSQREDGRDDG